MDDKIITGPSGLALNAPNSHTDFLPSHPSHLPPQGQRINHEADNIPFSFESFILGEGEQKVTSEIDTRTPNTTIFTFNKEDHTLGNLLRSRLLTNPHVTFSAYKVPHPMFPKFELRVTTDGSITPKEAVIAVCMDLVTDLSVLSREFTKEWELRKMVGAGGGNGVNGNH